MAREKHSNWLLGLIQSAFKTHMHVNTTWTYIVFRNTYEYTTTYVYAITIDDKRSQVLKSREGCLRGFGGWKVKGDMVKKNKISKISINIFKDLFNLILCILLFCLHVCLGKHIRSLGTKVTVVS